MDTLSHELSMQTSRLQRLVGYITYGFFESNKNRENQKVHPTQKRTKKNSTPVCDQLLSAPSSVLLHRPGKEASPGTAASRPPGRGTGARSIARRHFL